MRSELRVDWASHEAARFACLRWHYSRSMPAGKLVKVGVWEAGAFVGVVIFSRGANRHLLAPYGLDQTQGCELTRVALSTHRAPVSRIVSIALKFLKRACPGMLLVVSYADADEGHHGGIYQAGNWIYEGLMGEGSRSAFVVHGRKMHPKSVHSKGVKQNLAAVRRHLDPNATEHHCGGKHKYLMPLDPVIRARVLSLHKPYPRAKEQAPADHAGLGGVTPTRTLHPIPPE
jgi:hypothetical protein